MFVGETGVQRVVSRTADLMKNGDVRKQGGIDLATVQRALNLWYSVSLDLFGSEISTNAANFFAQGLKGRAFEEKFKNHVELDTVYEMKVNEKGVEKTQEVAMRNAMNEVLRDGYTEDCQRGVDKWNRTIAEHGIKFELKLPSRRFHRQVGIYSTVRADVEGNLISKDEFEAKRPAWLPSDADKAYVQSLMQKPIFDPKQMANWIGAPKQGIKGRPVDFEYVRHEA